MSPPASLFINYNACIYACSLIKVQRVGNRFEERSGVDFIDGGLFAFIAQSAACFATVAKASCRQSFFLQVTVTG